MTTSLVKSLHILWHPPPAKKLSQLDRVDQRKERRACLSDKKTNNLELPVREGGEECLEKKLWVWHKDLTGIK